MAYHPDMTDPLSFGSKPRPGTLYLSRYGNFVTELISSTGSWPDYAALEFRFIPSNSFVWTSWPATIDGAIASWNVDKDDVATVLSLGSASYRLFYTEGIYDLEWSKGSIVDVS